eukprot:TRINITY_DN12286_c0_g1_i3.p1 TRINITY_DN12286_c0_g1~~TRINITY_DN12286_c0_g1_i3.p1  ORF type:complete len:347 (+),score=45.54 TRINITY_DN12286_c0_g1_i3:134-1174(+)
MSRTRLPAHAEIVLQDWFDANLEHPYPSKGMLAKLVKQTRVLTLTQVRSWLQAERIRQKKGTRGKFRLPPKAIQIMTDYFESQPPNFKLSKAMANKLVQQTKLTEQQVRKWMSVARARAKKSLQATGVYTCTTLAASRPDATQTDGDDTLSLTSATNASPAGTGCLSLNVDGEADSTACVDGGAESMVSRGATNETQQSETPLPDPSLKRVRKKALKKLQAWFLEHLDHPYATPDEMARMAADMNISKKHVQQWLQNARYKRRLAAGAKLGKKTCTHTVTNLSSRRMTSLNWLSRLSSTTSKSKTGSSKLDAGWPQMTASCRNSLSCLQSNHQHRRANHPILPYSQ